jgi:hypothetical protein
MDAGLEAPACTDHMLRWEDIEHEFEWDGSPRLLVALDVGLPGWRVLCGLAQPSGTFRAQARKQELPADIEEVFRLPNAAAPELRLHTGGVELVARFGSVEHVELELDGCEVAGQHDLDDLLEFMRELGRALRASVELVRRDKTWLPILRYDVVADEFRPLTFTPIAG